MKIVKILAMRKECFLLFLMLLPVFLMSQNLTFDTLSTKFKQITYPDSSFCFFYYMDSLPNDNFFCHECFYKNKVKKNIQYFVNSRLNGTALSWYENGKLHLLENYVLGCPAGRYVEWYENGKLKESGNYYIDYNDSIVNLSWFENKIRTVDKETSAESEAVEFGYHLLKDGLCKYFDFDGSIISTEMWEKGHLIWKK